jgi:hypothetical protein
MPDALVDYSLMIKDEPYDNLEEMKEVPPFDQNITHWVKKLKDALRLTSKDAKVRIRELSAARLLA